jgi:hypothetical protein
MLGRLSLPPNAERAALAGDPIAISTVLAKPPEIATNQQITPEDFQERCIARLFFLQPETAATIARLAYGASQ